MRILSYVLFGLAVFGLTYWPADGQEKKDTPKMPAKDTPKKDAPPVIVGPPPGPIGPLPGPNLRHLDGRKLVFAIEGGGDAINFVNNLQDAFGDVASPVRIQMVNWCHNSTHYGDFVDQQAHLAAACRVAGWTKLIVRDCPNADIYIVGYGAGARVALAAAEMLPDKTVERVVLVAAGVSSNYDLRQALMALRSGVDSYWSPDDDFLDRIVDKVGTSDGRRGSAAGRVPFRIPPYCDAKGVALYKCYLHQHKFGDGLWCHGGHCSWALKHNLKKYMVPLILQPHIEYHASAAPIVMPVPAAPFGTQFFGPKPKEAK